MPCTSAELLKLTQLLAGDASAASRVCEAFVSGSGQEVEAALSATYAVAKGTARGLDTSFLLFSAYMVGIMQLGFACYAAGVVRARNMVSLLMKVRVLTVA